MKIAPKLSRADLSSWLERLQSWQLKQLAFLTGLKSTGTKLEIGTVLSQSLDDLQPSSTTTRILSIDMGVKNLAFCLLETRQNAWQSRPEQKIHSKQGQNSLRLLEWQRLDVSGRLMHSHKNKLGSMMKVVPKATSPISVPLQAGIDDTDLPTKEQANMYSPSSLSKVAYSLATEFIKYRPDKILIERQRFRSGGAPAIQEWTVRVNMLESMIWASLETMHNQHMGSLVKRDEAFPEVLEMSPRRIGLFWLGQEKDSPVIPANISKVLEKRGATKTSETSQRTFEKKDKIALARYWLRPDNGDVECDPKLSPLLSSFLATKITKADRESPAGNKRRKKSSLEETELLSKAAEDLIVKHVSIALQEPQTRKGTLPKLGKLDDLADCLVQGVTYALWEENRRQILQQCQKS